MTKATKSHLALMLLPLAVTALRLNVTAIGARDGRSTLECWQLETPFSQSTQPGTAGTAALLLSEATNITYTAIPSNFDGGFHNAPFYQWVVFIAGLAHITLSEDNSTAVDIAGGEFGLIFAADIAAVSEHGHRTQYPGITETIALQIPTKDGKIPNRDVIHAGPCRVGEVAGLREIAGQGG
ncbi:uncharacterized protein JN550_007571 [Neoarthrinium moseri]|uniref:uncharacterized protein n=1 Tax=Neoarthrinium moseri TaxID=1658444 RepID=UPI001FDC32DF|nr:uncharacterized protein JN550_007571 [Neoarthrinium moseri]KAI1866718.1 hypothetical protein JN550_007571 [Neoarthrinium moseri]